ncbi:putative SUI1/eIF-1 [Cafeteria roenbergensis virus]|uniref:Putative SUI1/eIF-1 n=1 Tax=Cafeteria roenbergensis virus (strain BV-PW1) TaxID=693272 RepID=E3T4I3_CROVB|nr:putative SUI1/eIF-1 [Cafeteria roenbergensis virus BV-PW1]ADO67096.1 putative SUI1/eIF-1 [Cafeteria roenbergensis virus BV-PW1]
MADDFNTFENSFENDELILEEQHIIIRIDKRNARKSISYVEDWNLTIDELKNHLKKLKTKYGCNGSVKTKNVNGKNIIVFQLQGDKRTELINYLQDQGIEKTNLTIIG